MYVLAEHYTGAPFAVWTASYCLRWPGGVRSWPWRSLIDCNDFNNLLDSLLARNIHAQTRTQGSRCAAAAVAAPATGDAAAASSVSAASVAVPAATSVTTAAVRLVEPLQLNSDFINHYRRMFAAPTSATVAVNKLMTAGCRLGSAMTSEDKG